MATPTSPAFFLLHVFLILVCSSKKGHAVSANEITKTYFRDVHADSLLPSSVCDQSNKGWIMLIFPVLSSNSHSEAIFGNLQQKTYEVVYDVAKGMVGFAPGGC
ncbi:hypothetical protein SADUNF_Sadunf18G0010200 [Salix dunnii]|uniref:Peptidase A1 domain-containing protein n=1 Tax=Salix dunnii TaxID=1413687 RepID=A0A835J2N6_9ROSI|nr:hypothetical protein SADUNF_Sadunf18G0010200 [Salix dunnii]